MNKSYYYKEGGGVTFRSGDIEFHTFKDFDLVLREESITEPLPRTNYIDIPFRDGFLDLSEPFGEENITYEDRFLYLTLSDINYIENYRLKISEFEQHILGRKIEIILDKDPTYYYIGRCTEISDAEIEGECATITATFEVEPYRYSNCSAQSPWLWDPFCFIDDMAIDSGSFEVDGTLTRIIYTGENDYTPTITVSSEMTVEFEGKTYTLKPGITINYDIRLRGKIENILKFTGHGTVTIDYRGGRF